VVEVVSVQNRYSLDDRAWEGMLAQCTRDQIAFLPWAPLGSGRLTADARLTAVAAKHQATPGQVALAWLLAHSPAVVIIPGTGRVDHLEENLGTQRLNLDVDDLGALERIGTESLRLG
jgi:aryl-alcohol dehydrogenase-like predicted oxidoreductase